MTVSVWVQVNVQNGQDGVQRNRKVYDTIATTCWMLDMKVPSSNCAVASNTSW